MSCPADQCSRLNLLPPIAALLLVLSLESHLSAKEQPSELSPYAKGMDGFRLLVKNHQFFFVHSWDELTDPSRSLLIVLGDLSVIDNPPGRFERFIESGGAVLAATDHKVDSAGSALRNLGISVTGRFLWQDVNRENAYLALPYCPIVEPAPDDALAREIFAGLPKSGEKEPRSGVATNLPSFLEVIEPLPQGLSVVAWMPAWCTPTYTADPPRGGPMLTKPQRFMVGGTRGRGRLLILADHSIFINQMMQRRDNSNLEFASLCLAWLNESGDRDHVCFIEDGVARDDSDIKIQHLPQIPIPPPPSLDTVLGMGNQLLAGLEQEDVFNRILVSLVPPHRLFRWMLYLATIGLLAYGIWRLRKGRHQVDVTAPLLATAVARATPGGNPIEQRNRALLDSGNLWEPASLLARQFFETVIGTESLKPATKSPVRYRLPPFRVNLRGLRGWLLGQRVRRLWRFAHMATPQAVTIRQFRKLTRQIADLKVAASRGTLRFSSVISSSVPR